VNRLVCGDALEVLRALPDAHIDLIYVDPPFATGRRMRGAGGSYDDRTPGGLDAYLTWLESILGETRRVLAPKGSIFVHLDFRAVHHARVALDRIYGANRLVNEIVWCYSVGGKSPRSFGRKHDTILWFARDAQHHFFADAVRVPRRAGSHMKVERDEDGREVQVKRDRKTGKLYRYPVHAGKVPEDWWTDIETLNRGDRERTGWPTQKPEALLARIIAAASPEGGLVADFFSGSGTAATVAHRYHQPRFLFPVALDDGRAARGAQIAHPVDLAPGSPDPTPS